MAPPTHHHPPSAFHTTTHHHVRPSPPHSTSSRSTRSHRLHLSIAPLPRPSNDHAILPDTPSYPRSVRLRPRCLRHARSRTADPARTTPGDAITARARLRRIRVSAMRCLVADCVLRGTAPPFHSSPFGPGRGEARGVRDAEYSRAAAADETGQRA